VRRLATSWGAVDIPDARRIHATATARMGGLAVFAAFVLMVVLARAFGWAALRGEPNLVAFMAGALLVTGVGAVDDLRRLRPHVKLAVEIVAALLVVYFGDCRISGITSPGGSLDLGAWSAPFTVLWIVLVTNALNLIDGIDGLATGTAAIALITVTVIATGFGFGNVAALAAILAGTCIGFLVFNFHPASIFLGDSGSLFIGFSLGVLSSYARAKGTTGAITLATLLIVALPLGDTVTAVTRRYFSGLTPHSPRSHLAGLMRIFQPDSNHLHHRLLRAGLGQRSATTFLIVIQAIACAYALYLFVRG
jgi:UDP-GlcNAc:undecaprenyl-phosphate GlcNAc-1-phosphate transferase